MPVLTITAPPRALGGSGVCTDGDGGGRDAAFGGEGLPAGDGARRGRWGDTDGIDAGVAQAALDGDAGGQAGACVGEGRDRSSRSGSRSSSAERRI